ncbi:MAG: chemotaxis protein CheW [Granulosicoccus sp.]
MTQYLLFDAGGLDLAAPSSLVKAIHEDLNIQAVAGTNHWFKGLAVAHGKLLPVTDMGAFAGRRSSSGRTLELDPSASIAGLQVDSIVGLSDKEAGSVPLSDNENDALGAGSLTFSERAIVSKGRNHRVLDISALVQSPEFLNITEQP